MNKNNVIRCRISEEEKKEIFDYCNENNLKLSVFMRNLLLQKVREEKEKENK